jgi:hypothetical protein
MGYNENYPSTQNIKRHFIEVGDPFGPEVSLYKNLLIGRQQIILLSRLESRNPGHNFWR